ncbi:MAG TPA: hypothetical protein VGL78_04380 [Solirubrobacteraceae bacterium]|jgi:hypothetical protein
MDLERFALTPNENESIRLISDADAAYLRTHLPEGIYVELLAALDAMPEDLRPILVRLVCQEAEPMGENALVVALDRLTDATSPPGDCK